MKILKVNYYPNLFFNYVYEKHRDLLNKNYKEQLETIFYESYSWGDSYTYYLKSLGYETSEIIYNALEAQKRWLVEKGIKNIKNFDLDDIVIRQINEFNPDILFYDHYSSELLKKIKANNNKIKLFIGWVGSAIPNYAVFEDVNLVLSCAKESVDALKGRGIKSYHFDHAFDKRIKDRIAQNNKKKEELIFIGQLIKTSEFHNQREVFLEELAKVSKIKILSPTYNEYNLNIIRAIKTFFKRFLYSLYILSKNNILIKKIFIKSKIFGKIVELNKKPIYNFKLQFSPILKKAMKPGVFGLEMFQIIKESKIVLNFHADSSPKYASNMRLFETTGVGSCLLTDWKENIGDFFEDGKEVVTYKSYEEALEKIKYLLNNPNVMEDISLAGQKRTLRDHCFEKRILEFDKIIKANI